MDSRQLSGLRLRGSSFATPPLTLRRLCLLCGREPGFATLLLASRRRIRRCDGESGFAADKITSQQGSRLHDVWNDIATGTLGLRQRKERRRSFSVDATAPGATP